MHRYRQPARVNHRQRPFGVLAVNGLNFGKSVTDNSSRLARVVNYLRGNPGATKRELIIFALGHSNFAGFDVKGWGSAFWSLAVQAGFLTKTRDGKRVRYGLGPLAARVTQ